MIETTRMKRIYHLFFLTPGSPGSQGWGLNSDGLNKMTTKISYKSMTHQKQRKLTADDFNKKKNKHTEVNNKNGNTNNDNDN